MPPAVVFACQGVPIKKVLLGQRERKRARPVSVNVLLAKPENLTSIPELTPTSCPQISICLHKTDFQKENQVLILPTHWAELPTPLGAGQPSHVARLSEGLRTLTPSVLNWNTVPALQQESRTTLLSHPLPLLPPQTNQEEQSIAPSSNLF